MTFVCVQSDSSKPMGKSMELMCQLTHHVSSVVNVGNQLSSVKEHCGEHVMKLWCIVGEVVVQLWCSCGAVLVIVWRSFVVYVVAYIQML